MKLPDAVLAKTPARFDSLIAEGRNILASAQEIPAVVEKDVGWEGNQTIAEPAFKKIDPEKYVEWRTKAVTLLTLILPKGHVHRATAEDLATQGDSYERLQSAVSFLRGIKDDLEKGFLDDMAGAIEAEIACDYMGQAQQLLAEGHRGKFDHVPAAALAGAVLEKALRTLCDQQQTPIAQKTPNGVHKTLGPLIEELKKAGTFNEAKAKQLRAWADIRNLAAHGEFAQFKRSDVEAMITGINCFLADHLK
jgi:hypothetical protein